MPLFMVVLSLIITGCCCGKRKYSGTIFLDHGEVFTRERLVNERVVNQSWLQNALSNTQAGGTLQGARFQAESTSLSAQVSAQFNPLGANSPGGYQTAQSGAQIAQMQNQIQLAALTQEYNALQTNALNYTNFQSLYGSLQTPPQQWPVQGTNGNTLVNIVNTPQPPQTPVAMNSPTAPTNLIPLQSGNIQVTPMEAFQDQLAFRDAVLGEIHEQELDDTHDESGMTLYSINFHLSVAPGDHNKHFGRVSANFAYNDDQKSNTNRYYLWLAAFRKAFDQETISIQRRYLLNYLTDDDIRQLVVESWKYQHQAETWLQAPDNQIKEITARYAHSTDALCKITAKHFACTLRRAILQADQLSDFPANYLAENISTNILNYLSNSNNASAKSVLDNLPGEQQTYISNLLATTILDGFEAKTNMYYDETNASKDLSNFSRIIRHKSHGQLDLEADEAAMKALCWVVKDRFDQLNQMGFGDFMNIKAPEYMADDNTDFMCLMRVRATELGIRNLEAAMHHLETNDINREFVYAVEPKEYAQNLMDESDKQNSTSLGLGLAAAIPQISTALSAYISYLKQSEYMLETIKRRPLLTSYMDGNTNFGWLIGGRFKIDEDLGLSYEQVPVQEAVQVTLEVPSWWPAITVNATSQWLKVNSAPKRASTRDSSRIIALKPDYNGITRALLEQEDSENMQPEIYPTWDPDQSKGYIVQAGAPATLVIMGRNLWRNPQVFIGSQSAQQGDTYSVLPDMQGIVAKFGQIQNVSSFNTNSGAPVTLDLRVVTSDGEAVLRDAVTIISTAPTANPQGFVVMTNAFAVAGGTVTFAVLTNAAVPAFASYQLGLSPMGARPAPVSQTSTIANGSLTFQIPSYTNSIWANATEGRIDVYIQTSATAEPASVLRGGEQNFVIFTNSAQSQFVFSPGVVKFSGTNLSANQTLGIGLPTLPTPALFWDAHLGLQSLLKNGSAQLTLTSTDGKTSTNLLSSSIDVANSQILFCFTNAANIQAITNAFNLQNAGQATCNGTIKVPPQNPQFTIPVSGTLILNRQD
ncbi:MAG TPA: hypothetical protein VH280_10015 [Verrucomicrobiae bacterium]|nr:hypothetical protein [Verrucomicrobiae bacterium]